MRQNLFILLILMLSLPIIACDPVTPASQEDANISIILPSSNAGMMNSNQTLDQGTPTQIDQDQFLEGPTLNSIIPTRVPLDGQLWIRIIGTDFRTPMLVDIGGQSCIELEISNPTMMRCLVPAWPQAESVDVSIAWDEEPSARPTLVQALTYFVPISIDRITPTQGSANGNTEVSIYGNGFLDPTDVRFNQTPALSVEVVSEQELKVVTPAGTAGLADVIVRNQNGSDQLEEAYRWQTPVGVDRIEPTWAWIQDSFDFTLYGYGLLDDSQVSIADRAQTSLTVSAPYRITGQGRVAQAGWASISVQNGNGSWSTPQGILLLDQQATEFTVYGMTPQRLASDTGGYFMIGGAGFDENVRVSIEDRVLNCELEDTHRLRCFTPSHPNADVIVRIQKDQQIFEQTLTFYTRLEIYQLNPDKVASSGGALVKVTGRGLTPRLELDFDGVPVSLSRWISPEEIWIQVPAYPVGMVDVNARQNGESVYLPQALEYFDPTSRYGGVWGDPIQHSVNVTVLNIYDFSPVENAQVTAYPFADGDDVPLLSGLSNREGQVTLSKPYLDTPLNITVFKEGYETYTIERVVNENATVLLFPFEPPASGEGSGDPIEPVTLRGNVVGIESLPKPLEPGYSLRVFVDVSHTSRLNRNSSPVPNISNILTENGPFTLVTRPGQMSLIVTAAYVPDIFFDMYRNGVLSYWYMRRNIKPIAMGMLRYLSLSPGAEISGLQVHVDLPTTTTAPIHFVNPPRGVELSEEELESPNSLPYQVRAILDLGPDGYWELDTFTESTQNRMVMNYLPDLEFFPEDITLDWYGLMEIEENHTQTHVYHQQSENLNQGVRLAPIVSAPQMIVGTQPPEVPMSNDMELSDMNVTDTSEVIRIRAGDTIRWDWKSGVEQAITEPPEATIVRLVQGGLPIWSYTLPGGTQEVQIASRSSGNTLPVGEYRLMLQPLITEQGLNYQDYTLLDLNNIQSYTIHMQVLRIEANE